MQTVNNRYVTYQCKLQHDFCLPAKPIVSMDTCECTFTVPALVLEESCASTWQHVSRRKHVCVYYTVMYGIQGSGCEASVEREGHANKNTRAGQATAVQ